MDNMSKWNQPQKAAKRAKSGVSVWRGVIAALVVVVGAAVAFWFVGGRSAQIEKPDEKIPAKTSLDMTKSAEKSPIAKSAITNVAGAIGAVTAKPEFFNGVPIVSRNSLTNSDGTVVEKIRTSDGKSHRITKPLQRMFESASDQILAMAICGANSGVGMPPLPLSESVEADFRKSLESPIVILETDSDEAKLMKLDVLALRNELKDLVSQGMTVRQALEEHQTEVNRIAAYHQEALKMLAEIRNSEGPEAAKEFLDAVNKSFKESGTPQIPEKWKHENSKKTEEPQR